MPALDETDGRTGRGSWPGIIRILLIQVMMLAAVAVAAVYYVDWSSNTALAEFSDAFKASLSDHSSGRSAPIRRVESRPRCVPED